MRKHERKKLGRWTIKENTDKMIRRKMIVVGFDFLKYSYDCSFILIAMTRLPVFFKLKCN